MQKTVAWGLSAAVVAALLGAYYLVRLTAREMPVAPAQASVEAASPPQRVQPAIRYPIEQMPRTADASAAAAASPVPALDASDSEFGDSLARLIGHVAFDDLVRPEDLIRHIVVTVDNLPRRTYALRLSPVKPIPGPFLARASGDKPTLADANPARYAAYVNALDAVDTRKLVAAYVYFYPLFQQAYRELGYPNGYFNDRVVEAIDVLLSTPDLREPVALAQPRVLYQYADPDFEALPSGQKIMLRMGADNALRVRTKLIEIRQALAGHDVGRPIETSAPSAPAPSSTKTSGG